MTLMTNNQALLLNLEVFLATNNIRRGVLSVATNTQAQGSQFVEQSFDIPPNSEHTVVGLPENKCTVIRTLKPVNLTLFKDVDTEIEFSVNSLFVFTDNLHQVVLRNPSLTEIATVRLLQV